MPAKEHAAGTVEDATLNGTTTCAPEGIESDRLVRDVRRRERFSASAVADC